MNVNPYGSPAIVQESKRTFAKDTFRFARWNDVDQRKWINGLRFLSLGHTFLLIGLVLNASLNPGERIVLVVSGIGMLFALAGPFHASMIKGRHKPLTLLALFLQVITLMGSLGYFRVLSARPMLFAAVEVQRKSRPISRLRDGLQIV